VSARAQIYFYELPLEWIIVQHISLHTICVEQPKTFACSVILNTSRCTVIGFWHLIPRCFRGKSFCKKSDQIITTSLLSQCTIENTQGILTDDLGGLTMCASLSAQQQDHFSVRYTRKLER
jgi:hypothetical protein